MESIHDYFLNTPARLTAGPRFAAAIDPAGTAGKTDPAQLDSLKKTTEEFEAMFLSYLFKVMQSTVETNTEGSSLGKDIYVDLFDNEIALNIARSRGLGIGDMLYRQLKDAEGAGLSRQDRPDDRSPLPAVSAPQVPESSESSKSPELPAASGSEGLPPVSRLVDGPVSSKYGLRTDPFTGVPRFHKGIDIAAPSGTPFHAVSSGTVVFAGVLSSYGNTVVIEKANGDRTLYAHASHLAVRAGDAVDKDQVIGLVGSTGRSTGPHLHFEAEVMGEPVDPQVLLASGDAGKDRDLKIFSKVFKHSHDK